MEQQDIDFIAEKVMGCYKGGVNWGRYSKGDILQAEIGRFNPFKNWAHAGMVYDRLVELGYRVHMRSNKKNGRKIHVCIVSGVEFNSSEAIEQATTALEAIAQAAYQVAKGMSDVKADR